MCEKGISLEYLLPFHFLVLLVSEEWAEALPTASSQSTQAQLIFKELT